MQKAELILNGRIDIDYQKICSSSVHHIFHVYNVHTDVGSCFILPMMTDGLEGVLFSSQYSDIKDSFVHCA